MTALGSQYRVTVYAETVTMAAHQGACSLRWQFAHSTSHF
jgi:hypothetical protein